MFIKSKKLRCNLDRIFNEFWLSGYCFIIPYLFLYLLFKILNLKLFILTNIFIVLHILNFSGFCFFIFRNFHQDKIRDYLFWLILFLVFWIPGAYLEFPSDPWEHFRRIFSWQSYDLLLDNGSVAHKFTYFWGWTLMFNVQPIHRRIALDLYSAFWQLLLAYQFYRLALKLGTSKSWARVQVIGTICLFGSNVFGFYRYFALSSTPLSYIAYLGSLNAAIDIAEGKIRQIGMLCLSIPLIYYNHAQGLLLLAVSTIALSLYYVTRQRRIRSLLSKGFLLAFPISYIIGAWLVQHPQLVEGVIPIKNWMQEPTYLSRLGTVKAWDINLSHFETLGVHGVCSLIFSVIFYSRYKLISFLTLTPYVLFQFPPFVFVLLRVIGNYDHGYVTFRLLLAFPTSFMLVLGLRDTLKRLSQKFLPRSRNNSAILAITLSIILMISSIPMFPYRGRLWFQIYQPPVALSLANLDRTAQWLSANYSKNLDCALIADGTTNFMVVTHFSNTIPTLWGQLPHRTLFFSLDRTLQLTNGEALLSFMQQKNICSLMVVIPKKMNPLPLSTVGKLSGHWHAGVVRENLSVTHDLQNAADFLQTQGWTKTFVPPAYWLYQIPK